MPGTTERNLSEWLSYVERQHPKAIALGLDRIASVRQSLCKATSAQFTGPVITVGGTNGKGSTCAMLEAILRAGGYRVGLYTSPHLLDYNERIRIDGAAIDDDRLCQAFERVEAARVEAGDAEEPVALTYFEYGTLAAWEIFSSSNLDVVILEVGLGGRLDAVNAFDPDCAVITSVDMDHMDFLGDTREKIGGEKAGIFRAGRPAIVADPLPPASVVEFAQRIGADLQLIGRDFGYPVSYTHLRAHET